MTSNYLQVRQFTNAVRAARGMEPCPDVPSPLSLGEIEFIVKMALSELCELIDTRSDSSEHTIELLKSWIGVDPSKHVKLNSDSELIAAQADSFVDIWYYFLDCCCKKGINLSEIFELVHDANMRKIVNGKIVLRESDGKVLKPENWQEANVVGYFKDILDA